MPRVRIPRTETEEQAVQLFAEMRELWEQYQREVPRKRKPWPESIRRRVVALWGLGVSCNQISQESGVPVMTLYSWRQRARRSLPGFSEIAVRPKRRTRFELQADEERRRSDLQLSQSESRPTTPSVATASPASVTLVLPNGVRIEGIPMDHVRTLVRELEIS